MLSNNSNGTVSLDLTATLLSPDGNHQPIEATLRYVVSDPYAIHATFTPADGAQVTWVFARDLLTTGALGFSGFGDVQVWRSTSEQESDVYLGLVSPDGEACIHVPGAALTGFLVMTYAHCAPGEEHAYLDVDRAIEALLAS
jgi:hypothetical protein